MFALWEIYGRLDSTVNGCAPFFLFWCAIIIMVVETLTWRNKCIKTRRRVKR